MASDQQVTGKLGDFISREVVDAMLHRKQKEYSADGEHPAIIAVQEARMNLLRISAADVVPVHRGEWVEFDGEGTYQCTYCGEPFILMNGTPRDNEYNYCPKCGAYLREGLDGGEYHAD